jgi:hypothetical protein
MNKEKLWAIFLHNNPGLAVDPALTPEALRRFFDLVWNAAFAAGADAMAERDCEIEGGSSEEAQAKAEDAVMDKVAEALAAFFTQPGPTKKVYVKKSNTKKTNSGGK